MGVPAPLGVATPGVPGSGDVANAVLSGTISAIGPTQPIAIRGAMNLALWASINTALTTTAGSLSATVASATGLAVGDAIKSTLVPPGSTIGALSGTTVTLAVPPVTYYGVSRKSPEAQIINLPVTAGLLGATVSGANIPANDTVASIAQAAVAPNANWPGVTGIVNLTTGPNAATCSVLVPAKRQCGPGKRHGRECHLHRLGHSIHRDGPARNQLRRRQYLDRR
jgi:hypothetical protein